MSSHSSHHVNHRSRFGKRGTMRHLTRVRSCIRFTQGSGCDTAAVTVFEGSKTLGAPVGCRWLCLGHEKASFRLFRLMRWPERKLSFVGRLTGACANQPVECMRASYSPRSISATLCGYLGRYVQRGLLCTSSVNTCRSTTIWS